MGIIFEHTWIMFIAVTVVNGLILKYRSKDHIARNPELEAGYKKYFWGWIFYGNIPWFIMMVGSLTGITKGTFEYLEPKGLNPMVILFHISVIMLWILLFRWVFFKNGAEFLEAHPGLFRKTIISPSGNFTAKQIKVVVPLFLLGATGGIIMMWVS